MSTAVGFYYVVYDRDGDIFQMGEDLYDFYNEAYEAGKFWDDDPRYGSHDVCEEEA